MRENDGMDGQSDTPNMGGVVSKMPSIYGSRYGFHTRDRFQSKEVSRGQPD
jgi:hypothetical protein